MAAGIAVCRRFPARFRTRCIRRPDADFIRDARAQFPSVPRSIHRWKTRLPIIMSPASAPEPIASAGNDAPALVRVVNLSKEFPAGSTSIIGGKKLSVKAVAWVHLGFQPGGRRGLVG